MANHLKTISIIIGILSLSASSMSGELAIELKGRIASSSPSEIIPVWIQVKSQERVDSFRSAVSSSSESRADRHAFAMDRLQRESKTTQKSLLGELTTLRSSRLIDNVNSYWIANVITAEIAASELARLAARSDVVMVYEVPQIRIIEPISVSQTSSSVTAIESNLTYIKADAAWALGYTGQGRVICSFDSGVDGTHPALNASWKGKGGDSAAAWFDPLFGQSAPHLLTGSSAATHGTWTTGVLVGHDPATGETTGVALDAKWIATYVTNISGASIFDAYQWAADPDRNPNTVSDVPDVINHSWGFDPPFTSCVNLMYDLVDNSEALGIVNIFAAGNRGVTGIQNPADGAKAFNDSLSSFAIGAMDHRSMPVQIVGLSSRGPSTCFGAIKPNVVAPGMSIRTSNPGATAYAAITGTSLAAPHVSGLVALLRQKNPNATVDQIKQAILNSTVRSNFGPVPNNNAGWGEIDCVAAISALSSVNTVPNVRLYDFSHAPILPGDTVRGVVNLQNLGAATSAVSLVITGGDPALTWITTAAAFGNIAEGQIVASTDTLVVVVADTVTPGALLKLDITISGSGFSKASTLYFQVGTFAPKSKANHAAGRINFTVTNYGSLGLGQGSLYPAGGLGFNFDNLGNDLFEAGIILGTGFSSVSSGVHGTLDEPTGDFLPAPGGELVFTSPGPIAFEQTTSKFTDVNAANPLGVVIKQETFARQSPNDDFLALRYVIQNTTGSSINGLYFGIFLDWDATNFQQNAGGYDFSDEFLWTAHNLGGTKTQYRGVRIIDGSVTTALTDIGSIASIYLPSNSGGDGFTDAEKFNALRAGLGSASTHVDASNDLYQLMAVGPLSIGAGQFDSVTFALLAGSTLVDIRDAAVRAASVLTDVDIDPVDILPARFRLHQNYPNPFNPQTRISFDLPRASKYTLTIYNILGEKVFNKTGQAAAGRVNIRWHAAHSASGIYLYRVVAGGHLASRKMLLLK